MIVLGLDIGTVRVGVAWGDSEVGIAFPLTTLLKAQGRAEREIIEIIAERRAELIVVGLPLGPSGERTATCQVVESFVRRLERRVQVKFEFIDESFSSDEASERLRSAGVKRQKGSIDSFAACLILEGYFNSKLGS